MASKTVSKKLLTEAIFAGGKLATSFQMDELPNPDRMIAKLSGINIYDLYEDMLQDDHIYAVVDILTSGILRHKWEIYSKDKNHKEQLTNCFEKIQIRKIVESMVYGKLRGMAIFEIVWKLDENGYSFQDISPLNTRDFSVTKDGFVKHIESATVFDDKKYAFKFLVYKNKSYINPYGVADLLKCYYPWQFKKGGWRFWMTVTEKYGVPTVVVEIDEQHLTGEPVADKKKMDEIASSFYNIDTDTVICVNGLKDKGITVIEAKAKADEFKALIDKAEAAISKVIIGTHIIMDGGGGGSRALAEIGANINFRFKVKSILLDVEEAIDTIIRWYEFLQSGDDLNLNKTKFSIPYIDIQDWEKMVQAIDRGIPVSLKAIYEHVAEPEDEADTFIKTIVAPDPSHPNPPDEKKPIKESKSDTAPAGTDPKQKETRQDTSIPGKQDTGQNQ